MYFNNNNNNNAIYPRVPTARLAIPAFLPRVIVKTCICDRRMQKSRPKPVFATEPVTSQVSTKSPRSSACSCITVTLATCPCY